MDKIVRTNADAIDLLRYAEEQWQKAADYAHRDMWYESGYAQGEAGTAVGRVCQFLQEPGQ